MISVKRSSTSTMDNLTNFDEAELYHSEGFDLTRCGVLDLEMLLMVQYWFEGVLFMTFGVIGLFGTLTTIVILSTKDLRTKLFNQLLIALAILDILFIICSVPTFSFDAFKWLEGSKIYYYLTLHFLYAMTPVTLHASIFMTVALTVERYLAVCKPFVFRNLNLKNSAILRLTLYLLPVIVISIVVNIPKFFEMKVSLENNTIQAEYSEMSKEPNYLLYYTISELIHPTITTGIAPMVGLFFMSVSILIAVHKSNSLRFQITSPEVSRRHQISENKLAIVLIGIVVMHFICHLPVVTINISAQFLISDKLYCQEQGVNFFPPMWIMYGSSVTALLLMANTSCNFFIYCFTLRSFKAKLNQIREEGLQQIINFSRQNSTTSSSVNTNDVTYNT